jgi:hypothetical protein
MSAIVTGYKFLQNGAYVDFGSVFVNGAGNQTTGYTTNQGGAQVDIGTLFTAGSSLVTTGYKNSAQADLGTLFNQVDFTENLFLRYTFDSFTTSTAGSVIDSGNVGGTTY